MTPRTPLFRTREDAVAAITEQNSDALQAIQSTGGSFDWTVGFEFGRPKEADTYWAAINWHKNELDVLNLRYRLLTPTAAELERFAPATAEGGVS
jgi:hypothetical protein